MENLNVDQNKQDENSNMNLSKKSLNNLTETRKWALFFAILGFVGIGFMVLGAFFMGVFGSIGGILGNREAMVFGIITVLYVIMGAIYFFPVFYLLKFSTNMKNAIEQSNQNMLTAAFEYLKSHFRYMGIFTIAMMGLYIVAIFIILIVGVASIF